MQRAQTAIAEPWDTQVQLRPGQLGGDDHADQHADHAPHHRHDGELPYNFVVVDRGLHVGKFHFYLLLIKDPMSVGFSPRGRLDENQSLRRMRSPSASMSSNCPRCTAHHKAPRMKNTRATESGMSRKRMSIGFTFRNFGPERPTGARR